MIQSSKITFISTDQGFILKIFTRLYVVILTIDNNLLIYE